MRIIHLIQIAIIIVAGTVIYRHLSSEPESFLHTQEVSSLSSPRRLVCSPEGKRDNDLFSLSKTRRSLGHHVHGYLWRAEAGASLDDIYDELHAKGWRFKRSAFKARVMKRHADRVKDGVITSKGIINFSTTRSRAKPTGESEWFKARVTAYVAGRFGDPATNHLRQNIVGVKGCGVTPSWANKVAGVYVQGHGYLPMIDTVPWSSVNRHKRKARNRGRSFTLVVDLNIVDKPVYRKRDLYKYDKGICNVKIYWRKSYAQSNTAVCLRTD